MALAQLFIGGCAVVFSACLPIQQAQGQFVPPPVPPPPPPVFNPSPPNTTVPQPSYTPLSPSTPTTVPESSGPESTVPGPEVRSERSRSRTVQSGRGTSVAKMRSVHHYYNRGRFAGPTLGYSRYCGDSPCVRIHPSRFYGGPAAGLWWPGYYDYASGQFGRGRPRYRGYWRHAGYHGD